MDFSGILLATEKLYLTYGLPAVFFTNIVEISPLGWAIPGGTLLALGGFFAFGRPYYLFGIIFFGSLGAWTTFIVSYLLGAGAEKKLNLKLSENKRARNAKLLLKKHGPVIMTTSMLAGITRFWIAFAAGSLRYKFTKFLMISAVASLTWTSLMVVVGYMAGSERDKLEAGVAGLGILSWIVFALLVMIIYLKAKNEFSELQDNEGKTT